MRDSLSGRCWNPLSGMRWAAPAGLADALWTLVSYRCDPKFRAEPGARVEARSAEKALVEHFAAFKDGALMDLMQTPVAIVWSASLAIPRASWCLPPFRPRWRARAIAEPWHGSGAAEQLAVHAPGRGDEETGLEMETVPDSGNPSMNVTEPPDSTPVVPTVRSRSAQNSPNPPVPVTVAQGSQSPVDKRRIEHPAPRGGAGARHQPVEFPRPPDALVALEPWRRARREPADAWPGPGSQYRKVINDGSAAPYRVRAGRSPVPGSEAHARAGPLPKHGRCRSTGS